ncbi:hypothetical protein ACC695_40830, partial [Rhizobium ruizarguesonis]
GWRDSFGLEVEPIRASYDANIDDELRIIRSLAAVEHVDGQIVATRFPDVIEPWQQFKEMSAINHAVMPGVQAECRME